jgi:putative ABC transport system permease protein
MLVTGFISNGDTTTIYVGNAWLPSEKYAFQNEARGMLSRLKFFDGKPLGDDLPFSVGVSQGLAELMDSAAGSDVIFMAPTVHGQINAVDAQIIQLVGTSMEILEDKWAVMPLSLARSLHDTGGASRINLLLGEDEDPQLIRSELREKLAAASLDVDVKTWRELSPFFVKVERMFDIIFGLVFITVSLIIVMSVVNTVTMSVLERSREIGTLRAIGAQRGHIVTLFGLEGALLGMLGCSLGLGLLAVALAGFSLVEPHWTPPHLAGSLPLEIYVVPQYLGFSALLLTLLALISGSFPARKVARGNIVEALGHV